MNSFAQIDLSIDKNKKIFTDIFKKSIVFYIFI